MPSSAYLSSFKVNHYNPACIIDYESALIIFPYVVDASQAGEGQLEISINDGRVPNKVDVLGGGKCLVTFTPMTATSHWIDVKFNGEQVPECPVECKVFDLGRISASGQGLERVMVGRPERFQVDTAGAGEADFKVDITCKTMAVALVK